MMNAILAFFTPAKRRWLYSITAGVNALALAVVPVLVSLGLIDLGSAEKVLQVSGAVLALASTVLAIKNIPAVEPVAEVTAGE